METDNTDVTASLPSALVIDAMTFDVTANTPAPSSVRSQGKLQPPAMYVCINTYMCIQQKHKQTHSPLIVSL